MKLSLCIGQLTPKQPYLLYIVLFVGSKYPVNILFQRWLRHEACNTQVCPFHSFSAMFPLLDENQWWDLVLVHGFKCPDQCCRFSRNIAYVTPKNCLFLMSMNIFIGSKYPKNKLFNFERKNHWPWRAGKVENMRHSGVNQCFFFSRNMAESVTPKT